jgi:hypothetical protein
VPGTNHQSVASSCGSSPGNGALGKGCTPALGHRFLEKCDSSSREYEILKNGVIDVVPAIEKARWDLTPARNGLAFQIGLKIGLLASRILVTFGHKSHLLKISRQNCSHAFVIHI